MIDRSRACRCTDDDRCRWHICGCYGCAMIDELKKQEKEMFYLFVDWQMELERERAIQRGLELDERLLQLRVTAAP